MSLILSSTTDKVEVVTSGTADIEYVTDYVVADKTTAPMEAKDADNKVGAITSATTTDLTGSPAGANDRWYVTGLSLRNKHASASNDLTVRHVKAGGTARELLKVTLYAGEALVRNAEGTWFKYDATGAVVMGSNQATTSSMGLVMLAQQSDMEAATDATKAVTASVMRYHPGVLKAWLKCGITGNILASYNVTSITDTAVGAVTVTLADDFSSANWACTAGIESNSTTICKSITYDAMAAGSIILRSVDEAASNADPTTWSMQAAGDM